ncbi:MAG TPA: aminomethyl-transferring glycine dehydrogenase subunit GcvPB [Bacillota bacterium]|nr:aminomethyl-transferring glycine dehydrogenase subunit GcvPB [Bacillota bacterium]HPZ21432.1 aminomethyl-transferring glycine dehydrogenase subunit GcvPB [Bacillota bacterium]HQD19293.1 aminomethyl-transferring glycine dehydrogenase subunit GcvPB [Bacillota bacterium]
MKPVLPLIFEKSVAGRIGYSLPAAELPLEGIEQLLPQDQVRQKLPLLPEVSEGDVIRHYINLSLLNHNIDRGFYPLGSCTMKYNPKVNEDVSRLPGFARLHPLVPEENAQGALELIYQLEQYLAEISGMDAVSLQPVAGAHGELTGLKIILAYHKARGDSRRQTILVPDSAHGTNPASAAMVGMKVVQVASDANGCVSLEDLRAKTDDTVAALMLTNPNTLGLFDVNIGAIADIVHGAGGLLYYDGANANAILGKVRPGDTGFDVVHLNLHKTFSTPHGGGGPGSGPVGVKSQLIPFLPVPRVVQGGEGYSLDYNYPQSIGKIHSFYGNFAVNIRAYAYIRMLGAEGLKAVSEDAVLNANYIQARLKDAYHLEYDRLCMHEFVLSAKRQLAKGVKTLDIAKRLLDFGLHPPTVYFPLIIEEAMMIEPTETEGKETLDYFIEAMLQIAREAEENPEIVLGAPHTTPISRLDEVGAARNPVLKWQP